MSIEFCRLPLFSLAAGIAIILTALVAVPGCNPAPAGCVFSYSQQQSGTVSTIVWPAGAARSSTQDSYAPNFQWRTSSGKLDSLSNHLGQIVLLNFWASWCGPCTAEMPAIQNVADSLGDSIFVIGVADDACSPWASVTAFVQNNNTRYQIAVDSEWALYEKYFPAALSANNFPIPETLFIGRDGTIKQWREGEESESAILSVIAQSK
jgi:thiol-disulfide isomerase/thioredoxin